MIPQLGASLTIVILTNLEVALMLLDLPIMLLENIYNSASITHDDQNIFTLRPLRPSKTMIKRCLQTISDVLVTGKQTKSV
jgi:hypothetical protein